MKKRRNFKARIHKQPRSKINLIVLFKNINIFKYLSIILIVVFIILIPAVIKRLVKINKIECYTETGDCLKSYKLGNYDFVKKQIEKDLSGDIQVGSYLLQYKIPSTIKIDLVLKRPKYAIKDTEGKYNLLDKDGIVIKIAEHTDLPILGSKNTYQLNQTVPSTELFALRLLEKVRIVNTVNSAEIRKEFVEIRLDKGLVVMFPLEGDVDVLVGSLRLIFSRLNEGNQGIRMEDVREIDLRFKNPVLR